MGALGALGIGLSVLFGLFLAVLAAEIYYMLCCRRGRLGGASNSRRVSSVQVVDAQAAAAVTEMAGFACEAAMVGSFGGYPSNPYESEFVSKFFSPSEAVDCTHISPFDGILFTIAEETKEEMELHSGNAKLPNSPPPVNLTKPVVDPLSPTTACSSVIISLSETSACASSTSLSFSVTPDATPFTTPPSSPSASDTSSDASLPSTSPETAVSRFSAQSFSPASTSTSPATAASRFSLCSISPSSVAGSPATANSRFSAASPVSMTVSPATTATRFAAASPASTSPASQRSSVDASYVYGDHGPLGALFRRSYYNSPSRYSPLRPVVWSGHVTDFRHALPFSPSNAQFSMNC